MSPVPVARVVTRVRAARFTRRRRTSTPDRPDVALTAEAVAAALVAAGLATDARHVGFPSPIRRRPDQWLITVDLPGSWDGDGTGFAARRRFAAALGVDEERVVFDSHDDRGRLGIDVYDRNALDVICDPWTGGAR